jgi:nucleotide-binding universal stress UspA family protein
VETKSILVPHDFTVVGEAATRHAIQMARQIQADVHLLHVVKSDSEKAAIQKKFSEVVAKLNLEPNDVKVFSIVKAGSIFTDIATVAEAIKASLIIMGTHGAKGLSQKMFGSFAIKVINSTFVPFVVVQDVVPHETIKKIVFPIETSSESLQVLNIAANLALEFGAEVLLVAQKETDTSLAMKIKVHLEVVNKQLAKKGVTSEFHLVEKSKSFDEKIMKIVKANKVDMVAVAYHDDSFIGSGSYHQSLITNDAKIPVLIIKAKESGNYFY